MLAIRTLARLTGLGLVVAMSACAVLPEGTRLARFTPDSPEEAGAADARIQTCKAAFAVFDRDIRPFRAQDVQDQRVPGFPWYRINRPLAAIAPARAASPAMADWLGHLASLDRTARQYEARNAGQALEDTLPALEQCRIDMMARDLGDPARRARLLQRAVAGSVYKPWLRQAGLYDLTSLGVSRGYENWKADNLHVFSRPPVSALSGQNMLVYKPAADLAAVPSGFRRDGAGMPVLSDGVQQALFRRYAPALVVGDGGDFDRVGKMVLSGGGEPDINLQNAVVYYRLSHTVSKGQVLPQLIYSFWFSARPKTGMFDILGGDFDGLILRVTLDDSLRPILYDSVHQCGCYHLSFPVPPWKRVPMAEDSDHREAILVPASMAPLSAQQRPVLWMASASHYILGMTSDDDLPAGQATQHYVLADDNDLRSLARPDGSFQSLFGPTGIIEKSSRLERFILWPMGIENAGAMRQWGHHAIAFVGHRHFDDPTWFDQAFSDE